MPKKKYVGDTELRESYFYLGDLSCGRASAIALVSLNVSVQAALCRQGGHLWDFGTPRGSGRAAAILPPAALPDVRKLTAHAQTYHILGSQQQYALFLLQK